MNRDELIETCFGPVRGRRSGSRIVEVTDGADVLAHVDLSYRRVLVRPSTSPGPGVSVAAVLLTVAALSYVCVDPAHRGVGNGRLVVEEAQREAGSHASVDFVAVFADGEARSFFERLGYEHPEGAEDDPDFMVRGLAHPVMDGGSGAHIADRLPEPWPAGAVDTQGRW